MKAVRLVFLSLAVLVFGPLLFSAAVITSYNRTVGHPGFVKETLREARLYENLHAMAIYNFEQATPDTTNEVVIGAYRKTVTPEVIQTAFEQVIDDTYAWMNGDNNEPTFSVDVTPIKLAFVESLEQELTKQATALPVCTPDTAPASLDSSVLDATCLPPGTNVQAAVNQAIDEFLASNSVLSYDEINADTVFRQVAESSDDESADSSEAIVGGQAQNLDWLAKAHRTLKRIALYIVAAGVLCVTTAIILLSKTRLHGVRKVGVLFVLNGLLLLALAILVQMLIRNLIPDISVDLTIRGSSELAARLIAEAFAGYLFIFGFVCTGGGLVAVIASSVAITKRPKPTENDSDDENKPKRPKTPPSPTEPDSPPAEQNAGPAPRPPARVVQVRV